MSDLCPLCGCPKDVGEHNTSDITFQGIPLPFCKVPLNCHEPVKLGVITSLGDEDE